MTQETISGDVINKYRKQMGDVKMLEGSRGGVEFRATRNHIPINKYLSAGHIDKTQFKAAEKLYKLYVSSSHVHTPVQMRYDDIGASLKEYEKKFIINQEYIEALLSVGALYRKTIIQVCLDSLKCGRGNMEFLKNGLNDLVIHFKLDTKNR